MLDVREDEAAKEIRVSGRISSTYQKDDLMSGLKGAFGYMTIVDELEVDRQLPEVTWGNRVNDFLLPFLDVAKDAHFQYDKGVTLIEGTVKERKQINQIGNMAVYVMEAADSRGISNRVKVNEAGNDPEKK